MQGVAAGCGGNHNNYGLTLVDQSDRAVLELACGEALCMDVGDFLKLESAFHCDGEAHVAAEEDNGGGILHLDAQFLDRCIVADDLLNLLRHLLQLGENRGDFVLVLVTTQLCQV